MSLPRFFLFIEETRRLKAIHYSELCDIHAISICNVKYYKELKACFDMIYKEPEKLPEAPPMPNTDKTPVLDIAGSDAKYAIMSARASVKRGI